MGNVSSFIHCYLNFPDNDLQEREGYIITIIRKMNLDIVWQGKRLFRLRDCSFVGQIYMNLTENG